MLSFRFLPDRTAIPFIRYQRLAYVVSGALVALLLLPTKGLNFGIDFQGGILIEVGMPGPADLAAMRSTLGDLGLGEVALQEFGGPANVLIRVQRQEGGEQGQMAGVRPWGRTGSGGCFDRLPGVVVLELGGAQIAKG
jgi:preprotein translocase subunit SecF